MSDNLPHAAEAVWQPTPELVALAEVLKIAVPGLKIPHATMAATIARMLQKRGVRLALNPREMGVNDG